MTETWYVLADGSAGDPREITPGKDGRLEHKDGRKVAYAAHGPRSRSVDPEAERAKAAPKPKAPAPKADEPKAKPTETRDLKADEPKRGYATRESKAG